MRREVGDECRRRRFPPRRRPDASRGNPRPGLAATDDRVVPAAKRKYYTPPERRTVRPIDQPRDGTSNPVAVFARNRTMGLPSVLGIGGTPGVPEFAGGC